ncbi:AMP-dependent synthetase and ligase [Rhodobacteraceae bacterium HTCC2150]|nr:AMP-dependent synthetase and ligase [Rhodobacteraceae bacterium HTCC2150]
MIDDVKSAPSGTLRDWINLRADTDDIAFFFPEETTNLPWSELQKNAMRMAKHLSSLGVQKGESVAIFQPNGRDAVLALYAVLYGGFRATPVNLVAGADAIQYALSHSGARFAYVHSSAQEIFDAANTDGKVSVVDPLANGTGDLHHVTETDAALLMYTSGTTGRPKGVVHTQSSLLAGGWTTSTAHELGPKDRGFCVLPIYHINGLCVSVMGSLVSGGSIVMCPKFSASKFWQVASDQKITWFSIVPTIISHLLHGASEPDDETKERIRFGRSASSALAPEVQSAFEARFDVPIVETMGLTETAAQILSNPLPPGVRKIGSPGIAFGNEVAILSPDLKPLTPEIEGEIAVRGPNVMKEYLENPEANKATFTDDGWMRTGDLGKVDADGYIYVTGRLKELIIKGGENIAPREIDEALYAHADVIEAAAFARPCNSYGERVEAAVALRANSKATAKDLIALCEARVGKFKSPDHVHFFEELPKGPSGKIQRLKLPALTQSE